MEKLFSNDPVNKNRQMELDVAKGLSVIFMIAVHVLLYFANDDVKNTYLGSIVEFFGGIPAAPVFMFLLGVGIVYSGKATPLQLFKRGWALILGGYILNIIREGLPNMIKLEYEPDNYNWLSVFDATFTIDILQFAGLAFIIFSMIARVKKKILWSLGLIFFFGIINYFITDFKFEDPVKKAIFGLFWGASEISYFPFFSWIAYPLFGYIFGSYLIRCNRKKTLYSILFILSLAVTILLYYVYTQILNVSTGLESDSAYYHHSLHTAFLFLSIVIFWLSLLFFITPMISESILVHLKRWSVNVTDIYYIHYVIIGVTGIFLELYSLPYFTYCIYTFILILISDRLSFYNRVIKKINP